MAGKEHVIKMPDIGEGIAEVELVAWHVKPGDSVVEDQVLADVMTEKASVEIPSPVKGRVVSLGGEVGQVLAVGSELIRIEVEAAEGAAAAAASSPAERPLPPAPAARAPAPPPPYAAPAPAPSPAPSPVQAPLAKARSEAAMPATRVAERPIASPSVRRRAWELGVDLMQVSPTGPAGRIMHADIEALALRPGTTRTSVPSAAPAVPREMPRREDMTVPVVGVRRKIAQKMQESKRRIPHFTYVEEIDVTDIEALRARLNAKWQGQRTRLTLLPLLMRAVTLAVRQFPQMNARFDDEAGIVTRHGAVHIGIATQTASGLMVPVVRDAESRDLWANAAEVTRLADAARAGRATRDELTGSTITITSLGALGGIVSTPVINHPEVAIVGVNRIVERPVIRNGAIVARQMMNLSSSFDHRVVDGQHAAEFVQALRGYLECPATMFVE
jgi:2-oxoisovalerate dehydrogenase E2 component (dihydrolipoyl transacylase)